MKMSGYHHPLQKKDRIRAAHGGVISYVSERYKYDRRDDLEISNIETIWIDIKPINDANILACTVFRPDELDPLARLSEQFENEMENAYLENKEIIIMGDFNIDLMRPDEVPQRWKDIEEGFSLTQIIHEPTRVTPKSKSLLDHLYVTDLENVRKCHVPKSGMSDHYPTCLVHKVIGHTKGQHTSI